MTIATNHRVRIEQNKITKVVRSLPQPGELSVSSGQEVIPTDIIGASNLSGGFRVINLAKLLGESPDEASRYLQRDLGQNIYKGEAIAFKSGGLISSGKVVISPSDGILSSYDNMTGNLVLSMLSQKIELPASVYGVVEKIDPQNYRVIIRTEVTKIYGVLGVGGSKDGILSVLGKRGDIVTSSRISEKYAGHILVGGGIIFKDGITKAVNSNISGIITGGLNAKEYRMLMDSDSPLTMIITEGFDTIPIGPDIYDLLSGYNGRFSIINGSASSLFLPSSDVGSIKRIRATKLPDILKPEDEYPPSYLAEIEVRIGQEVRVVAPPFMGVWGQVVAVDQTPTLLSSRVKVHLVTIETTSRKIKVPYPNLEVIG